MKYIYTAVLTPSESGNKVLARVPDLPGCITSGKDITDAVDMITDAASLWLVASEDHNDEIPAPTPQNEIDVPDNAVKTLILIDTLAYRAETDTRAVRKNVSLPAWMANLADKRGINCSQVLQEGLMKKLA